MSATEKVVNDLNVSKLMLCNKKMLTSEMCVRIGQAINGAIDLLKEQEPKKIIRKQMSYEDPDGTITYYADWYCPHCNKVVQKGFDSPWLKYCFNCGKPILWD